MDVPGSAKRLAALAVAVALLPLVVLTTAFDGMLTFLHLVGLLGGIACAVPLFFRKRDPFRVACAAAGAVVAVISVPMLILSLWAMAVFEDWLVLPLSLLYLPVAAIPSLVAAFQRARGPECGRVTAVVARCTGGASLAAVALAVALL